MFLEDLEEYYMTGLEKDAKKCANLENGLAYSTEKKEIYPSILIHLADRTKKSVSFYCADNRHLIDLCGESTPVCSQLCTKAMEGYPVQVFVPSKTILSPKILNFLEQHKVDIQEMKLDPEIRCALCVDSIALALDVKKRDGRSVLYWKPAEFGSYFLSKNKVSQKKLMMYAITDRCNYLYRD